MSEKRDNWIDNIKVFACILVALGHFFQSMQQAELVSNSSVLQWFEQTIYYFHVPLFFICSGYIYQKFNVINSWELLKNNIIKKLLVLGVPYFAFSIITWILKRIFSSVVNIEAKGLLYSLFIEPMSPYWYLYALFLFFVITPTFSGKKMCCIAIVLAVLFRTMMWNADYYVVRIVAQNQVWFILGMACCIFDFPKCVKKHQLFGSVLGSVFIILSVIVFFLEFESESLSFWMGLLACASVVLYFYHLNGNHTLLSSYTMPVYLMHTIFAAGTRAVLMKMGISNPFFHIVCGITASFLGPIFAMRVMELLKLDILLYPGKYLKWKFDRGELA